MERSSCGRVGRETEMAGVDLTRPGARTRREGDLDNQDRGRETTGSSWFFRLQHAAAERERPAYTPRSSSKAETHLVAHRKPYRASRLTPMHFEAICCPCTWLRARTGRLAGRCAVARGSIYTHAAREPHLHAIHHRVAEHKIKKATASQPQPETSRVPAPADQQP